MPTPFPHPPPSPVPPLYNAIGKIGGLVVGVGAAVFMLGIVSPFWQRLGWILLILGGTLMIAWVALVARGCWRARAAAARQRGFNVMISNKEPDQ
ncbi:MAG TPA: hypothetical protein VEA69_07020 [Tepidisphaeraceae bacterium]|nr:hypothetical protein [Tepidisphaeraceae bacterium]